MKISMLAISFILTAYCLQLRPGAYPRFEHMKGAQLVRAPALPANIRLGSEVLPMNNALAYYKNSWLTAAESFVTMVPDCIILLNLM